MSFTLTSPITGATQTGLTSPTYTHVVDTAPTANGKQVAITALGGTQSGVTVHSVASPFTITQFRPPVLKSLGTPNPMTGRIANIPMNTYTTVTRKGVTPLVGQPVKPMIIRTIIEVPAGADLADAANIRAGLSAHIGALSQQSAGLGDTVINAVL